MKSIALLSTILVLAVLSPLAGASSVSSKCFEQHLRESIEINRIMRDFYLQNGQEDVRKVYRLLIGGEHFSLLTAKFYDQKAKSYHKQGMDLLCQEYVPMRLKLPTIGQSLEEDYQEFNWKKHKKLIASAIKNKNAPNVRKATLAALIELKKQPDYHCFTRHMLESIYRFAYFADVREQQSQKMGIKSPKKMLFQIMNLHNISLWFADEIDELAAPIQKNGYPILCNELPNIIKDLNNPELETLNRTRYGQN